MQRRQQRGHVAGAAFGRGGRDRRGSGRLGTGLAVQRQREAVAATGHRGDRVRPEQLAQREHLDLQVVVLDDPSGPDEVEQLGAGDRALAPLDEGEQQLERASADLRRPAVDEQLALGGQQDEAVESVGDGRHAGTAGWNHDWTPASPARQPRHAPEAPVPMRRSSTGA